MNTHHSSLRSLCLHQGTQTPIVVLQDTGASQSLLLKDKLPREANTYIGSDVLLQGVDLEVMSVPSTEYKCRVTLSRAQSL